MKCSLKDRLVIWMHNGIKGNLGKTGLSLLRYSKFNIVAVIDKECADQPLNKVTGIQKNIPIVSSIDQAMQYTPSVFVLGVAPSGGQIDSEMMSDIVYAVEKGFSKKRNNA